MSDLFTVSNEEVLCIDKFIGDENCGILCSKFRSAEGGFDIVKRLILRGNCLGSRGAQSISEMLKSNCTLQILSLEWNQLGSSGLSFLAIALEYNSCLLQIDLRNNGISDDGAVCLAESLAKNKTIQVVDLRWNQIGDEGAQPFEQVFKARSSQLSLLLAGNLLSMGMAGKVEKWNNGLYRVEEEPPTAAPKQQVPPAPVDFDLRNKELLKELEALKHELSSSSKHVSDLQRQVDSSAIRVTDLEQGALRDEYKIRQLEESLGLSKTRVAELSNELSIAQDMWSKDRVDAMDEHKQQLQDLLSELTQCSQERDSLREKYRKARESVDTLQIQCERIQRKAQDDVNTLEEELRVTTQKCAELSVKEAKAHGESTAAVTALERMKERAASAESELELTRAEGQAALEAEQDRCHDEISRVRKAAAESAAEASRRSSIQSAEISSLNEKLAEVNSEMSTLQLELKQRCEDSASKARDMERARAEQIIENLKQRLEVANTEKRSAEDRYTELTDELKQMRQETGKQIDSLQATLNCSRDEEKALQLLNKSLREKGGEKESELLASNREILTLRSKVSDLEEKLAELQSQLKSTSSERDDLQRNVSEKDMEIRDMKEKRIEDLRQLSSRLSQAVTREIESCTM